MWTPRRALALFALLACCTGALGVPVGFAADVNALYKDLCVKCHGPEGKGDGDALKRVKGKVLDWSNKAEMSKVTDTYLYDITWLGGAGVGKSKIMPAYKGKMTEEEAKQFVPFVRSFAK
jgi:mono/diheme cytochrome c family protein